MKKIKGAHRHPGRQRRMWSAGKIMLKQHTCASESRKDQNAGRNCCSTKNARKKRQDPEHDGRGDLLGESRNTFLYGKEEDTYNMNMDACGCIDCV